MPKYFVFKKDVLISYVFPCKKNRDINDAPFALSLKI